MEPAPPLFPVAAAQRSTHFLAQVQEGGVHPLVILPRGSLKVGPAQLGGQCLPLAGWNLPCPQEVALVAHQYDGNVAAGMNAAHVLVQWLDGAVAAVVCDGEDQHIAICPVD